MFAEALQSKASAPSKTCFVVGPIGDSETEIRIHADWFLEDIVEPTLADFPGFKVLRSDKIASPGMIDAQVIKNLFDAELVVADLSYLNPNAFYELGIRHMVQKPIVHMQLADDVIPFDVSLYRAIKFSRKKPSDIRKARADLKAAVDAVLVSDYVVDNPITRARGQIKVEQNATPQEQVLFNLINGLSARLERLEGPVIQGTPIPLSEDAVFDIEFRVAESEMQQYRRDLELAAQEIASRLFFAIKEYRFSPKSMRLRVRPNMLLGADTNKLGRELMILPGVTKVTMAPGSTLGHWEK